MEERRKERKGKGGRKERGNKKWRKEGRRGRGRGDGKREGTNVEKDGGEEGEEGQQLTVNPWIWLGKVAEKRRICRSLGMNAMSLSRALW